MILEQQGTTKNKIVLLIEDSPTQAVSIQAALAETGLEVICATDGAMGLRLASQTKPNVIVLDILMPGMNGFQVCEAFKKSDETAHIPVILFTLNDSGEALHTGLELGAVDFIPKDAFAKKVLQETIKQMGLSKERP